MVYTEKLGVTLCKIARELIHDSVLVKTVNSTNTLIVNIYRLVSNDANEYTR